MKDEYYLINKKMLPEYFNTILKIKEELDSKNDNVSFLCQKYNISRSTFYKYKDYIFEPMKTYNSKAILAFHTSNEKGVLSSILNVLAASNANILSLNQEIPIHNDACITITIDATELNIEINELITQLEKLEKVTSVNLLAYEG